MVQSFQASGGLAALARPPDRDGSPGRTRTSDMVVNSHPSQHERSYPRLRSFPEFLEKQLEQIQIGLTEFKGWDLVGVRIFADNGAEIVAMKKGITFKTSLLPEVIEALDQALKEAKAAGVFVQQEIAV